MKASDYFYRIGQSASSRGARVYLVSSLRQAGWPQWAMDSYARGFFNQAPRR